MIHVFPTGLLLTAEGYHEHMKQYTDYDLSLEYEQLPDSAAKLCVGDYLSRPSVSKRVRREAAGRHAIRLRVRGSIVPLGL